MRKQNQAHHQNQAEHQIQAQAQVQQQNQGGADMKPTQQPMIYFVTFPIKLDPEKTREVLSELRRRFPAQKAVFTPVPPSGRRKIVNINGILTILTFPHTKQEEIYNQNSTGFTLKELAKIKKT